VDAIAGHVHYWLSAVLLIIGLYGMLARPNLIRKLMGMNILQVAVIMFFITVAAKTNATLPIALEGAETAARYINPLPHALMLTALVVSISTTGVALALAIQIYRRYGTLNEAELLDKLRE
jgi:multicomponent Na+:H+ antiporter subunit C